MKKEDFNELISNGADANAYDLYLSSNEYEFKVHCLFKYSIGASSKTYPIELSGDISEIASIEEQFNEYISIIYNSLIDNNDIILKVTEDSDGKLNYKDFINYAKIIKKLVGLQRLVLASLNEIQYNYKKTR